MNEEIRQAAEAVKDPTSYGLFTYAWVVLLSAWGGTVRFIRKVKAGEMSIRQAAMTLMGELVTSVFAGVITFYACEANAVAPLWTAVLVSVAGHMGGKALEPFESIFKRWFGGKAE
jgi:hypothetical protein